MAENGTTTEHAPPESSQATPSGGRTASDFRDIGDALRSRVDLFGKTLAAVATTGTAAVGLNEIGDLFPEGDNDWWVVGACVSLAVAGLAAIGVAYRLMRVSRPVFLSGELPEDTPEALDSKERQAVQPVFETAAKRFGYSSLATLEQLERILRNAAASSVDDDERARRTARADEVKAEIEQALARGQVVVIRRRAANAVGGWSWPLYFLVIAGLIMFAVSSDRVSSDREDLVAQAKACGEARTAKATADELRRTNGVCTPEAEPAEQEEAEAEAPTAAEARASLAGQLNATLQACAKLVHKEGEASEARPLAAEDCDPLRRAVSEIDPPAQAPTTKPD